MRPRFLCGCVCARGSEIFHDTTARPRAVNYVFFVQLRSPTHKLLRGRNQFHLQESSLRAVAFIELVEIEHCVLTLFPCVMGCARTTVRAEQVVHRLHGKSTSAAISWRRRFRTNWSPRRGICTWSPCRSLIECSFRFVGTPLSFWSESRWRTVGHRCLGLLRW